MNALAQANEARLNNALSKLYRYHDGIKTLKQNLDENATSFEVKTVPKYEYNRRKYNNMDWAEQEAYETKLKQTKTIYVAYYADGSHSDIPKMVYEYYTN